MRRPTAVSLQQRNLLQAIAGGLRAELADDLRAPLPEQLATLMRRLEGDRNGHSGEGVRLWDKPTRNVEPC
jgi:hypothetical protein